MTDNSKCSSLLRYGNNYCRKKFYSTGLRGIFHKHVLFVTFDPSKVSCTVCPRFHNVLAYFAATLRYTHIMFMKLTPGADVIKRFTVLNNCHSIVIPSFRVIKVYYLNNYCGMAVNYNGICITNVIKHN